MKQETLLDQLLNIPDQEAQNDFLNNHLEELDDEFALALKTRANTYLRSDIDLCMRCSELLLYLSELTGNSLHRALSLLARANGLSIGLGEHLAALEYFEEVTSIYHELDRPVDMARSQIAMLWSLASLGRYDEAIRAGNTIGQILEEHEEWTLYASVLKNLGIIHGRSGDDQQSLDLFDRALSIYHQHGAEAGSIAGLEHNRAIVLRNLGRFDESVAAIKKALELLKQYEQPIREARAKQCLATTYYMRGQYNDALKIFEKVKDIFLADGRQRDAILADLFISDCLLELRRYPGVLNKCQQVRQRFSEHGNQLEVAQALLNSAIAHAGLQQYEAALTAITEARDMCEKEANLVWTTLTNLERSAILQRIGRFTDAYDLAVECIEIFRQHDLSYHEARANLAAARASLKIGNGSKADNYVRQALELAAAQEIPTLLIEGQHLLGNRSKAEGKLAQALVHYKEAIQVLEQLRSKLMIEHRIDFVEDRSVVYEDAVETCLQLNQITEGLDYVERAKSRALIDLLTYRATLDVRPRKPADQTLIDELLDLRAQRDRLYRVWRGDYEAREREGMMLRGGSSIQHEDLIAIENSLTELWHKLLIRNADYVQDAALWIVKTTPIQPLLPDDMLVIEYFFVRDQLVAFLITSEGIQAQWLPCSRDDIQQVNRLLRLNFAVAAKRLPDQEGVS